MNGTSIRSIKHAWETTRAGAKLARLMVGLLLFKQMKNLSDVQVLEHWVQNPYFQALYGMQTFQWKFPCDSSDIT